MNANNNRLVALFAGILGVAVIAIAVVGSRPPVTLDRGTPQGVVQAYLQASLARDFSAAVELLEPGTSCKIVDFDNTYIPANAQAALVKTAATATSATVDVSITVPSGDLLGNGYTESHTYRLTKTTEGWRMAGIPWPLYNCGTPK